MANFLSEIFSFFISSFLVTICWSGFIFPETIPSPCPKTASIKISSEFVIGFFENITPDLSEFIIFWTIAAIPTKSSKPFFLR